MKMTYQRRIKMTIIISFIILTIIPVGLVGLTEAWFYKGGSNDIDLVLGDFDAAAIVRVNDTNLYNVVNVYDGNKGLFHLNGVMKSKYTAAQQIGEYFVEDIVVNILANADIEAYLRVKVITEWKVTRKYTTIQRDDIVEAVYTTNPFQYDLVKDSNDNSDWYYDQTTGYAYYKVIINKGLSTIPFIDGAEGYNISTSRNYIETCDAILGLQVELVQANRWEAIWGISSLPWEA